MIRFACPGCSATFTVGDEKAGKTGKCPKCQSQFVIPAAEATASPPVPPTTKAPSAPPLPPPPPPPADPNAAVEIHPCPKCDTRLSVLPTDVGLDIQCPSCDTVFKAHRADAPPPPDTAGKSKGSSALVKLGSGSRRDDDEDDEDRPSKRKSKRRDDDEDDEDRPSKRKSRRRDDDDEDEDDRPSRRGSRRRRRSSSDYAPHRADMLLILAIVGLLVWRVLCVVVWVLASNDLKEMDAGRMDPEGRSKTSIARILGIVGTCLIGLAVLLLCLYFGCLAAVIGGAGAGAGAGQP